MRRERKRCLAIRLLKFPKKFPKKIKKAIDRRKYFYIITVTVINIIISQKETLMIQRKYSRQREAILENLKGRTDHPTADMVYTDIRQQYPNISLGTVYRNLSLLSEERKIQKLVPDDGVLRFDYNLDAHDHFVCRNCGDVSDVFDLDTDSLKSLASEKSEGQIDSCVITFYGLCNSCLKSR